MSDDFDDELPDEFGASVKSYEFTFIHSFIRLVNNDKEKTFGASVCGNLKFREHGIFKHGEFVGTANQNSNKQI